MAVVDLNIRTMVRKVATYVLIRPFSSPYDTLWPYCITVMRSVDIFLLYATVLNTIYNMKLCRGFLLSLRWQLLGCSWLGMKYLCQLMLKSPLCLHSRNHRRHSTGRSYVFDCLSMKIQLKKYDLYLFLVYTGDYCPGREAVYTVLKDLA